MSLVVSSLRLCASSAGCTGLISGRGTKRVSHVALLVKKKKMPANAGHSKDVGLIPGSRPLQVEMATLSSILDWKIPWTEELGGGRMAGRGGAGQWGLWGRDGWQS